MTNARAGVRKTARKRQMDKKEDLGEFCILLSKLRPGRTDPNCKAIPEPTLPLLSFPQSSGSPEPSQNKSPEITPPPETGKPSKREMKAAMHLMGFKESSVLAVVCLCHGCDQARACKNSIHQLSECHFAPI
ncbi:hypothetical protein BT96DRAFT_568451 [Gymnopus androsaceus JB14]|uniref:Uncharacterized protein n=1 Tax=Gymnopus androsaceus JB14 TaxID=1447944 RepID=A0A6A4GK08_9AGAR|nr:hypothetical protein BT96DRAFT_568451 [Gymnopus androsaceus JB14]